MAASEFKVFMGVPTSLAPAEIHYIKRPGHSTEDIVVLMTLAAEAQAHYSFVSLLGREGHILLWNESQAVQLEMRRGTFVDLRRKLLIRKYLLVSPIGMVPQVEDLDAAVYVPYAKFLARKGDQLHIKK